MFLKFRSELQPCFGPEEHPESPVALRRRNAIELLQIRRWQVTENYLPAGIGWIGLEGAPGNRWRKIRGRHQHRR